MPGVSGTIAKAGKNARTLINSTTLLSNVSWEVAEEGDVIDDTGTEDAGYQHAITGTKKLTWRVDAFWDSAANAFASPPNIAFGAELTSCKQYLFANATGTITTGKYWDLGTVLITGVRNMSEVKGGVKYSFNAQTQSAYSPPS